MNNQPTKWLPIVTRRITVFRTFITAHAAHEEVKQYLGIGSDYFTITKNEMSSVYLLAAHTKKISERMQEQMRKNPLFPGLHAKECKQEVEKFVEISKDCGAIIKSFPRYVEAYQSFGKFMVIPVAIERALTEHITEAIVVQVKPEKAIDYIKKLMTPPAFSEFQQEQIDLLRLALTNNDVSEHSKKYCWLSCYNIDDASYEETYFSSRLEELKKWNTKEVEKKLAELEKQIAEDEKIYTETLDELHLTDVIKQEIALLRHYVYLRTYRVEMQSKANYYIQPLFIEIAHALNLSLRHVTALSPSEITEALENHIHLPSAEELEKRCLSYAFRYDDQGILFVSDEKETEEMRLLELGEENHKTVKEIKGTPAYIGQARGKVRVVLTKKDIKNFQAGEILVTTMTTPEFVPAMKKAIAIVTDEGGVLCHAAIVARELQVPCIIGTGRATAIFSSGDVVDVDGKNGMVKKV